VDKQWKKIEQSIKEAAEETIQEQKLTREENWFDEECAQIMKEKNIARQKMLEKERRANTERYQELRRKVNKICKKKKKENMKERLEEIEQLSKQNERRKFYKAVDKAKRGFQPRIIHCKTKTGKVICEESKVLEGWEEHFKELLNKEVEDERMEWDETDMESVRKGKKGKRRKEEEEANIDPPTRWEVEYHIKKTKNNKAPGEANIVAELIKHGGEALVDAMHKLIRTIWETEKNARKMETGDHLSYI